MILDMVELHVPVTGANMVVRVDKQYLSPKHVGKTMAEIASIVCNMDEAADRMASIDQKDPSTGEPAYGEDAPADEEAPADEPTLEEQSPDEEEAQG